MFSLITERPERHWHEKGGLARSYLSTQVSEKQSRRHRTDTPDSVNGHARTLIYAARRLRRSFDETPRRAAVLSDGHA